MKKVISFCLFLKNSWNQWGGEGGPCSTSQSSQVESSCKKYEKQTLDKMLLLIDENRRLKEELRLRDLQENAEHDV